MDAETRAARDRIEAFLAEHAANPRQWTDHDFLIGLGDTPACRVELHASDLRTILAALDQQPDHIAMSDIVLSETEVEDWRQRFLAAQQDGTVRALDRAPGATEWGEPETQWTLGVRRPDGSRWVETHRESEADVRRRFDEMQDSLGYRKALLCREATAWREADNPQTSDNPAKGTP